MVTDRLEVVGITFVVEVMDTNGVKVIADKLSFVHDGNSQSTPSFKANASKVYSQKLWDDLVLNPLDWFDNREDKLNGLIHPKYPDFKNRKTYQGLWVNSAPSWVSERLEGLVFASREKEKLPPQQSSVDLLNFCAIKKTSWKNLIDNPKDWWDNRSTKPKKTYPDFKHKETGEALWLSSFNTPDWVLSKLPPVETTS
ncbi:hypothetical protein ZIOFF_006027 [Zingiber officinale]|uniref:Uncharacterized protein n=1 Tax=Zingiber officinale TaxID=94328 RepID=A0A8J5HN80_ZINOF|nr:hypothetical protein ZIOFF_006027 [Zingiber officinale]